MTLMLVNTAQPYRATVWLQILLLLCVSEDTYERTLTVDGEETTLIVMDTWENNTLVLCVCFRS